MTETGSPAGDLPARAAELEGLADRPVHEHPDILDRVHRALVDELEGLAWAGAPPRPPGRP